MQVIALEVYSTDSNFAVLKPPGRKFPGSVIQGDSLALLASAANHLSERLAQVSGDAELLQAVTELRDQLEARLRHYEAVLTEHGMSLPYERHGASRW